MNGNSENPSVSIIMPIGGTKMPFLQLMIRTLMERTSYTNWQLIAVDNDNPADIKEYLRSLDNISLITNDRPKSFAENCNQAIRLRKADYYLLFNADVYVLDSRWLDKMVEIARNRTSCGIVGGSINGSGSFWHVAPWGNAVPYHYYHRKFLYMKPFEVQVVGGFNMLIADDVVQEIGYIDEGFSPAFGEEAEYCIRAVAHGFRVFDAYIRVYHVSRGGYRKMSEAREIALSSMRRISLRWSYVMPNRPMASYPRALRFLDFYRKIVPLMPETRGAIPPTSESMVVNPLYAFFPDECVHSRFIALDRFRTAVLIFVGLVVKRLLQLYYEYRLRSVYRLMD